MPKIRFLAFPTLKQFPPGPRNYSTKAQVEGRTPEAIRKSILDVIERENVPKSLALTNVNFANITTKAELDAIPKEAENFMILVLGTVLNFKFKYLVNTCITVASYQYHYG